MPRLRRSCVVPDPARLTDTRSASTSSASSLRRRDTAAQPGCLDRPRSPSRFRIRRRWYGSNSCLPGCSLATGSVSRIGDRRRRSPRPRDRRRSRTDSSGWATARYRCTDRPHLPDSSSRRCIDRPTPARTGWRLGDEWPERDQNRRCSPPGRHRSAVLPRRRTRPARRPPRTSARRGFTMVRSLAPAPHAAHRRTRG